MFLGLLCRLVHLEHDTPALNTTAYGNGATYSVETPVLRLQERAGGVAVRAGGERVQNAFVTFGGDSKKPDDYVRASERSPYPVWFVAHAIASYCGFYRPPSLSPAKALGAMPH